MAGDPGAKDPSSTARAGTLVVAETVQATLVGGSNSPDRKVARTAKSPGPQSGTE